MAHLSYDQSASMRCKTHGHRYSAIFVTPQANEGFGAFYTCMHCLRDGGIGVDMRTAPIAKLNEIPNLPHR